MVKDPKLTVWLRLFFVLLVFFVLSVVLVTQTIRGNAIYIEKILYLSAKLIFLGPALVLFRHNELLATLGVIGFWGALVGTACLSRKGHIRRWFYVLLGVYAVMTSIGIFGECFMVVHT